MIVKMLMADGKGIKPKQLIQNPSDTPYALISGEQILEGDQTN